MEPTALQSIEQKPSKGRKGSLTNPEVHENVPGHVIPILERECDDFDTRAAKFMRGEESEDQFIGFRLKQGVYGQRQPDVQMIRVKLPFGGVTPEQMEAFGEVAGRYAPMGKGHITTRAHFQYLHLPPPAAAEVIRMISDSGLSSREACGNAVRNVTGDPWAGVTDGELYDITPYAGAFVRYFVRNEVCQLLPRKFKVAFTATDEDRAITLIHDLGFLPRLRDGVKGVEIRTGGGTSIMARVGSALFDFVEVDNGDYLKVSEAVLRIFNRQEDLRANRQRARIKFMIDRIGIAAIMRDHTGGYARTSIQQNIVLRWVRDGSIYDVWRRLEELDLGEPGAHEVSDVVSCPGTDSCKLGITSSMGLNDAVQERVESMGIEDPLTKRIHIKMSGCPNGCGQHHLGTIGFYGASIKVGDRQIPAYIAHVGGRYEGGDVGYGERVKVRLPAKRVPEAVERWIRLYESERQQGEAVN